MSQDNVKELIAQMQAAVKSAVIASKSVNAVQNGGTPAMDKAQAENQLSLINQLMLGVETRFGIKSGSLVERKLARILKDMPVNILRDWVTSMNTCSSEHPEWQSLVENLTVHETYFCRDPDLMEMVTSEILPPLIAARESLQRLQVWSAASSTGEEVYDMAYMCLKGLQAAGKAQVSDGKITPLRTWNMYVLGTDISNQALRTAREAVYGDLGMGSFRNLPQHWRAMFETIEMPAASALQGVNYYRIRDWVRSFVRFERFNLMNTRPPVQGMDLVFCRNVLIYFDDDIKRAVQKMLARSMAPGGVLVMGASVQMLATEYFDCKLGRGGPWYIRNGVPV